jgi:tRNA1Val (adenine37-N6)-methyltransferase
MFQFKQFSVDQSGCAMKINTDGVLLGALAVADNPGSILDIGTGTGVIALMLAQKFINANIDAVEIDENASQTAVMNLKNSPFADRMTLYPLSFEHYFDQFPERKYDLIVSNPPFYINSLKSPGVKKTLAKHTDNNFFERLIEYVSAHLTPTGCCWLILPLQLADAVVELSQQSLIYPQKITNIHSFEQSEAHRVIVCFGFNKISVEMDKFTIYKAVSIYSDEYKKWLQPYFIAF